MAFNERGKLPKLFFLGEIFVYQWQQRSRNFYESHSLKNGVDAIDNLYEFFPLHPCYEKEIHK